MAPRTSDERGYPRLGQAILLLFILLLVDVIGTIILEVAGVRAAMGSGADLALVVLTYIVVIHWVRRRTGRPWREIFPLQPFQPTLLAPLLVMVLGFSITGSEVDNMHGHSER